MMRGGGDALGTPETVCSKNVLRNLEILKDLATYLEIDSLAKLVDMNIAVVTPILPPAPTARSVLRAMIIPVAEKRCWYCNQIG